MKAIQTLVLCGITFSTLWIGMTSEAQHQSRKSHTRFASHRSVPVARPKPVPAVSKGSAPRGEITARPAEPVTLFGEVKTNGPIPFRPGMTVKQAIEQAGGFTDSADAVRITIRRVGTTGVGTIDGLRALEEDPIQNATLHAGDTLFVPRCEAQTRETASAAPVSPPLPTQKTLPAENRPVAADPGKIALTGAIGRPGIYRYQPMLLRQAIEAAGGLNKNADKGQILVHRRALIDPASGLKIYYDYNNVVKGKASDIALEPGDMVEVPVHRRKDPLGFLKPIITPITGLVKPLLPLVPRLLK